MRAWLRDGRLAGDFIFVKYESVSEDSDNNDDYVQSRPHVQISEFLCFEVRAEMMNDLKKNKIF